MAFQTPGTFYKFGPGGYWSRRKDAWGQPTGLRRGRESFTYQNERLGATNPNLDNQNQTLSPGTCPPCRNLPWWLIPLAALGLVETTVVLATKK